MAYNRYINKFPTNVEFEKYINCGLAEVPNTALIDDTGEINWVSFPSHLNDVFTDIMYDEEYVAGVNNRQCKFRPTSFLSKKYNKTGYGVEFL